MTMTRTRDAGSSEETHKQAARGAARFGLVARGVLFALLGVLALRVAFGEGGTQADSQGALRTVANGPLGTALLILLGLGFVVYAVWQAHAAITGDDTRSRITAGARALVWGALAYTAGRYVISGGSGGSNEEESLTATVLNLPFGTWLVALAGAAIIVIGVSFLRRVKDRSYLDDLKPMPAETRRRVCWAATAGLLGRTLVFALLGAFLIRAAVAHKPNSGVGLDGALSQVAQAPYGTYVLVLVAAGMFAYAVWCGLRARYEDIKRSDG